MYFTYVCRVFNHASGKDGNLQLANALVPKNLQLLNWPLVVCFKTSKSL